VFHGGKRRQQIFESLDKPTPSPTILTFGTENEVPPPAAIDFFNGHVSPMRVTALLAHESSLWFSGFVKVTQIVCRPRSVVKYRRQPKGSVPSQDD
jgi:hypothetical protein